MNEPVKISPEWYVNFITDFARRYVDARSQDWQDHDAVKAQGWAIMLAAEELRRNLPRSE
jgi:hypothetical protein